MNKTVHKKHGSDTLKVIQAEPDSSEQLITLMQEMKPLWQEAAADLLQPRPEAIAQLLKKVLH